jgi:hypothetical protein
LTIKANHKKTSGALFDPTETIYENIQQAESLFSDDIVMCVLHNIS